MPSDSRAGQLKASILWRRILGTDARAGTPPPIPFFLLLSAQLALLLDLKNISLDIDIGPNRHKKTPTEVSALLKDPRRVLGYGDYRSRDQYCIVHSFRES